MNNEQFTEMCMQPSISILRVFTYLITVETGQKFLQPV